MRPGSFIWLVAHDLRLAWRGVSEMLGRFGGRRAPFAVALAAALVHLAAWPLAVFAGRWLDDEVARGGETALAAAGLVSMLMWLTSQAMIATTRALFVRSDLDLLLASPVPAARVLAARAVAIAVSSAASLAFILLPMAHMGWLVGRPSWLIAWPALVVLALIGTAAGLVLTIAIFFLVGKRRARLVANLSATFVAGAFVLGVQAWLLLPQHARSNIREAVVTVSAPSLESGVLRLLADAAAGSAGPISLLLGFAVVAFAAAVRLLSGVFARAVVTAAGAPAGSIQVPERPERLGFAAGVTTALRRKEWRLLVRDPGLFGQLALQIIYTVPVAVVLARSGRAIPAGAAVAPVIVVVAAQISASLAWLTVSGEDAPELIEAAPVRRSLVERAKLGAMALPVATVLAMPVAGMALVWPREALITLVVAVLAATSTALINLWHPMPGNRRGMLRRHSQSKLVALMEHGLAMLWAVTVVLALFASKLMVVPLVLIALVLARSAPTGKSRCARARELIVRAVRWRRALPVGG